MTPVKQQYAELLALTTLFLKQEYTPSERLLADTDCYRYFREYAMRKAATQPQPAAIKPTMAAAPPPAARPALAPQTLAAPAAPPPTRPLTSESAAPTAPPVDTALAATQTTLPPPAAPPATAVDQKSPEPPLATASPAAVASSSPTPAPSNAPAAIFVPDVPTAATPTDLKELRDLVLAHFPGVQLLDHPPSDAAAKLAARLWERENAMPAVAILCFEEQPKQRAFLANIGKALEAYGIHAAVIDVAKMEQEKAWPRLLEAPQARLAIAGGYGLYTLPNLMEHYREGEKSSGPRLGRIPLLLLSDTALYLKEPNLKPSLWKALKELLK